MGLLSYIKRVFYGSGQPTLESSSDADYSKYMNELSEKMKGASKINIGLKGHKKMPEVEQGVDETKEGDLINIKDDE